MIQKTHNFYKKNRKNIAPLFSPPLRLTTKMLREKETELIISPATVRKNTRRLFFIGKHGLVVTTPMVPHPSWPRPWKTKMTGGKKESRGRSGNEGQKGSWRKRVAWVHLHRERREERARKCPQIITKIIHQRISSTFFSPSLSLFRLLNLRVLFFVGISYFLEARRTAIIVPGKRTTRRRITKTSWEWQNGGRTYFLVKARPSIPVSSLIYKTDVGY